MNAWLNIFSWICFFILHTARLGVGGGWWQSFLHSISLLIINSILKPAVISIILLHILRNHEVCAIFYWEIYFVNHLKFFLQWKKKCSEVLCRFTTMMAFSLVSKHIFFILILDFIIWYFLPQFLVVFLPWPFKQSLRSFSLPLINGDPWKEAVWRLMD